MTSQAKTAARSAKRATAAKAAAKSVRAGKGRSKRKGMPQIADEKAAPKARKSSKSKSTEGKAKDSET